MSSPPSAEPLAAASSLRRSPLTQLPPLHQIVLPTPWDVGPVQVYLVENEPLTLVDTGVKGPESRAALEGALGALGHRLRDVERVVLTHWHADHMGQVQTLRDAGADLELWVHEADAPFVERFAQATAENVEATNRLFREHGVPRELLDEQMQWRRRQLDEAPRLCEPTAVDRRLRGGESLAFKDLEFEVLHAPGHTAGHVLLHEAESGTLLTGDHLMGGAVPFTDTFYLEGADAIDESESLGRRARFRGLTEYLRSLRRLRGMSFRALLPAHGGILERPAHAIDEAVLFYEVRIQRVERALERLTRLQPRATGWELWRALFPRAHPVMQMRTRMLMVIGCLDVLEGAGRVRGERGDDGVLVYAAP